MEKNESPSAQNSVFLESLERSSPAPNAAGGRSAFSVAAVFGATFFLFLLLACLLIFVMTIGGVENPVIRFFGLAEADVKDFLKRVISVSFGFLLVVLLVTGTVGAFLGFSSPVGAARRAVALGLAASAAGLVFFVAAAWVGLYRYVDALETLSSGSRSNLLMFLPGEDRPLSPPISASDTADLVAPVELRFSLEEVRQEIASRGLPPISQVWWDFGEGFEPQGLEWEITRRFLRAGTHEVAARVVLTDGTEGQNSLRFAIPNATFRSTPADVATVGSAVEFDATEATSHLGGVRSFGWDLDGDGLFETETSTPRLTHRFEKIGNYPVTLRVIDEREVITRLSRTMQVQRSTVLFAADVRTLPVAQSNNGPLRVAPGTRVRFSAQNATSSAGRVVGFSWDFGNDGPPAAGQEAEFVFEDEGRFDVLLTMQDAEGNTGQERLAVEVTEAARAFSAFISADGGDTQLTEIAGISPLELTLSAVASGEVASYSWDLNGNGEQDAVGSVVTHTFRHGDHEQDAELALTLVPASGAEELVVRLPLRTQLPPLLANFSANPETAELPCDIAFDGSASSCSAKGCEIALFEWSFGDESQPVLTGAHVDHRFPRVGRFDVSLTVHKRNGETATQTQQVFCRETPLAACFSPSRSSGVAPASFRLDSTCSTGVITEWAWDFGDGRVSTERNPVHTFEEAGEYNVTLTVTEEKGTSASFSSPLSVTAE